MTNLVWIECQEIGCPNGLAVWHKHSANLRDRYLCPEHEAAEVTC